MLDLNRRMLLVKLFDQRQRIFRRGARIPNEPALFARAFDESRLSFAALKLAQGGQSGLAGLRGCGLQQRYR